MPEYGQGSAAVAAAAMTKADPVEAAVPEAYMAATLLRETDARDAFLVARVRTGRRRREPANLAGRTLARLVFPMLIEEKLMPNTFPTK